MANIEVNIVPEDDLTVFTVEGELTADILIKYCSEYYVKRPTKYVLWDVRKGTVRSIPIEEFRSIAQHMRTVTINREGGKTAFVGDNDPDFGMGQMYEIFAEMENLPVLYRVFRDIEEAREWLFRD